MIFFVRFCGKRRDIHVFYQLESMYLCNPCTILTGTKAEMEALDTQSNPSNPPRDSSNIHVSGDKVQEPPPQKKRKGKYTYMYMYIQPHEVTI